MQVAYNVADNVPKLVICDAQRLQQVLLNVLNNAVKFTEKGEVLLEVWCEAQEEKPPTHQAVAGRHQEDLSESASDSQDRPDGSQPLLGPVSKDLGQQVEVAGPCLEAFRPLTPDNLSQHTELAEMRQQVQGPAPSFAKHPGNVDALAASYNLCRHGGNCSCLSDKDVSVTEQVGQPLVVHQEPSGAGQEQHTPASLKAKNEQLYPHQNGKAQQLKPSDTFTAAPASKTAAGQQHIMATSGASANAIPASHLAASSSPLQDCPDAASSSGADEAAKERSRSDAHRRQAMDGCQEWTQARRHNSHASTSGRPAEDAAHYTLNFSVRDSGIGISQENLNNLFQCFCQVRSTPVYTSVCVWLHTQATTALCVHAASSDLSLRNLTRQICVCAPCTRIRHT